MTSLSKVKRMMALVLGGVVVIALRRRSPAHHRRHLLWHRRRSCQRLHRLRRAAIGQERSGLVERR